VEKQKKMVLSAEKRKALATRLNGMVDVPFLNEAQEQKIAESIIDKIMGPLESAMPTDAEMTSMARSAGEQSMQQTVKQRVVESMNKKIDIPGLAESHEAIVFGMVTDYVLKDKFEEIHKSLSSPAAPAASSASTATG
jgi:hypothetical protein